MSENASETRAGLLVTFRELSGTLQEMRGSQFIVALGGLHIDLHGRVLWNASDTELLEAVRQFRRDFDAATASLSRQQAVPRR